MTYSDCMDTRIQKLRKLNIFAGVLHLASLIAILALATDVSLPVRARARAARTAPSSSTS